MITVQTIIQSSNYKVWKAYTNVDEIKQWNFATPEWHCPFAIHDFVEGGTFNYRMESKDGSMGFDYTGIFKKIDVLKMLHSELSDGRNVVVRFNEIDSSSTSITVQFDPESINSEDLQLQGWQAILNQFKQYVETVTQSNKPKNGQMYWVDITVDNPAPLKDFYAKVLGWTPMEIPMKDGEDSYVDYGMGIDASTPGGGICHNRGKNKGIPPQWIPYFYMDNVDQAVAIAVDNGGVILKSQLNKDGTYMYVIIQDPHGSVFGMGNMG